MTELTRQLLLKTREVQAVTGPFQCLGSAKFFALKLIGGVHPSKTLYHFLYSKWAKRYSDIGKLKNCWGWTLDVYTPEFNATVLPAAVHDPDADVVNPDAPLGRFEFVYFRGHPARADDLLNGSVPLVVGVGFGGGTSRGHWITIVRDSKHVWGVDPWGGESAKAVKILPFTTFTKPIQGNMTGAGQIPCDGPVFGYYRDPDLKDYTYPLANSFVG